MKKSGEGKRKVFVGSVPGYFKIQNILEIFQDWGPVSNIKLDQKSHNPSFNKGFCILTLKYPKDAQKILDQRHFDVGNGRYIVCKPYLKGQRLQKEIESHDHRRIILKHIPLEIHEDKLRLFFEQKIGEVEILFIFSSDYQNNYNKSFEAFSRKWNSASVTFKTNTDVEKIFSYDSRIQEVSFSIFGHSILVQRYGPMQKDLDRHSERSDLELISNSNQYIDKRKDSEFYYERKYRSKNAISLEKKSSDFYSDLLNLKLNHKDDNLCFNIRLKGSDHLQPSRGLNLNSNHQVRMESESGQIDDKTIPRSIRPLTSVQLKAFPDNKRDRLY